MQGKVIVKEMGDRGNPRGTVVVAHFLLCSLLLRNSATPTLSDYDMITWWLCVLVVSKYATLQLNQSSLLSKVYMYKVIILTI